MNSSEYNSAAYDRQIDTHLDQISIKIDHLGKQARITGDTLDRHNELLPQLSEQVSDTSQHTEKLTSKIKKIIASRQTCCKAMTIIGLTILFIVLLIILIYS